MLWHWLQKCGLHQTLFITPRKWNTKTALANSGSERGWGDGFLTPFQLSLFYNVVNMRGKNNVAMLCGDFAEWVLPTPAVWLQNSELGSDHFALGRASVEPTSRLCAVTLAQINKSVCLQSPATIAATVGGEVYTCSRHAAWWIGNVQKSQLAFVWVAMWQESVANRQLECNPSEWQVRASIVIIQLLLGKEPDSFLQLVHELAGPSDLGICILKEFLCDTLLWQHSSISGKRVSIKRVDFSIRKLASVWPVWPFIISPGIAGMLWHWVQKCGLHQTHFNTPKVIPSQKWWNTKTALANSGSERGWGDGFLTPFQLSLFYNVVNMRGKNNVAMLCGDFAEWVLPAPAVWLQNSELWSDHFALGRASVEPTSRLCAVTLAQINKSVCLQSPATIAATVGGEVYTCSRHAAWWIGNVQKSQLAFVWITMIDNSGTLKDISCGHLDRWQEVRSDILPVLHSPWPAARQEIR